MVHLLAVVSTRVSLDGEELIEPAAEDRGGRTGDLQVRTLDGCRRMD